MTGKYFLSDILHPSRFKQGFINLIKAPVGSGKTHFALNELPKHAINNDYMLFITDTNMNRDQIISTFDNACEYDKSWREFLNNQPKPKIDKRWGTWRCNSKITVMNYAQVAALFFYGHKFDWSKFDYIVCDELHNLIYYRNIKPRNSTTANQGNATASILDLTIAKIEETLILNPHVIVLGMTATPKVVLKSFPRVYDVLTPQEFDDLYRYDVINKWYYRDYVKVLQAIPIGKKGIIYFDRISTNVGIKKAESILVGLGHKTGSFWSMRNKDHTMTQRQLDVRQYIVDNQMIPPDVDILLINAACQTGVNIKNKDVTFMVIHAPDGSDTLTQAKGRLRNDLQNLYYYKSDGIDYPNPVPVRFLNCKFPAEKTKELCAEIRYMKPKGNEHYQWEYTKKYLEQKGYKVTKTTMGHGGKQRAWFIELE